MVDQDPQTPNDTLSKEDMQRWLIDEIRDSVKALDLRVREATDLVTAYTVGKLSPKEATERFRSYDQRWGEALFGVNANTGLSDEAILDRIDQVRESSLSSHTGRLGKKAPAANETSL